MIIASKDNVVQLSGVLHKNQWLTIKATAKLLLKEHSEGIVIDCSELADVSADGAKTFLDAMRDIQDEGARIIVAALPENVLHVIRSVPGVRSQLPVAATVADAQASLKFSGAPGGSADTPSCGGIYIPIIAALDIEHALQIAARISRDERCAVHLVYFLEVARNLPLQSPLPEEEATANELMARGQQEARRFHLAVTSHTERVRDVQEGLLQTLKSNQADYVVLSGSARDVEDDPFMELVDLLLRRAPCSVLIGRKDQKVPRAETAE